MRYQLNDCTLGLLCVAMDTSLGRLVVLGCFPENCQMRLSLAGYRGDSSDTGGGGCVGRCGGTYSQILIPAAES